MNLDRDILQSFTGECVSVTVPVKSDDGPTRQESFSAMKCANPDKIRELLTKAVDALNQIPQVQAQQLKLEAIDDLPGFQKLSASIFQMFGAQPVIGFRDGWMMIGSHRDAVEKVLAVRDGKADSQQPVRLKGSATNLTLPFRFHRCHEGTSSRCSTHQVGVEVCPVSYVLL